MPRITPNLWFDTQGLEAAEFYVSVFPNSKVKDVTYYNNAGPGKAGTVLTVDFVLDGQDYTAINGGPHFTFDEAISLLINCADQAEVDYYWEKLTDGGEESQCGWLKDRYGVSWQVVPAGMAEVLGDPDQERAVRAVRAMLGMKMLDLAALPAAAAGADDDRPRWSAEPVDGVVEEVAADREAALERFARHFLGAADAEERDALVRDDPQRAFGCVGRARERVGRRHFEG